MKNLQHPETGGHILVSDPETAEALLAEGWEEIVDAAPAAVEPTPAEAPATPAAPATPEDGAKPPSPSPEKPLTEMKLTELIEHAAKIGMTEEQIAPLRKPGTSKAKAIEAISDHAKAA